MSSHSYALNIDDSLFQIPLTCSQDDNPYEWEDKLDRYRQIAASNNFLSFKKTRRLEILLEINRLELIDKIINGIADLSELGVAIEHKIIIGPKINIKFFLGKKWEWDT